MYTREQFGLDVLRQLGNMRPAKLVLDVMIAWGQFETASNVVFAHYNMYNTIQDEPGDSFFNTFGDAGQFHVKNYPDYATGIKATVTALKNGHYPHLLPVLAQNEAGALLNPSPALQGDMVTWGTGHLVNICQMAHSSIGLKPQEGFDLPAPAMVPIPDIVPPLVVELGEGKFFKLVLETINGEARYVVVAKHSSEASLKAKGYI